MSDMRVVSETKSTRQITSTYAEDYLNIHKAIDEGRTEAKEVTSLGNAVTDDSKKTELLIGFSKLLEQNSQEIGHGFNTYQKKLNRVMWIKTAFAAAATGLLTFGAMKISQGNPQTQNNNTHTTQTVTIQPK